MQNGKIIKIDDRTQRRLAYGVVVYEDIQGERIRRESCLCHRCVKLVTVKDVEDLMPYLGDTETAERETKLYNCNIAQANYDLCRQAGIAAGITRCPMFVKKTEWCP